MSLENRSTSAMFKRAEQLKRWEESVTNLQEVEPKLASRKIQFSLGCVFLAACAAGDKEEVLRLLNDGADIDTANVDGLTALHQACIDNNLDMVEFLVNHGADVNRGDNEGWTPLHATASCGFISIAKYLIENGANVAAVNNDGELPLDISDSNAMDDILQDIIDAQGIDCEEARNREEIMMLEDAKDWLNGGNDCVDPLQPHPKTGATALHVAAAKGYIKVMNILLQGQADVDVQDFDGWTPLHAAAHWGQKEAAEMLVENFCNMDLKNYVGQTAMDVADSNMVDVLEDLRTKQAALQKDRPPPNNLTNKALNSPKRRSSITRMSVAEKTNLINKDATSERQIFDRTISEEPSNKVKKVELDLEGQSGKEDVSSVSDDSNVEGDDDEEEDDDIDDNSYDNDESESSGFSYSCSTELQLIEEEKKNRVNLDEPIRIPSLPDLNKTALSTQTSLEEEPSAWRRPGSFRNKNSNEQPSKNLTLNLDKKVTPNKSAIFPNEVVLRRTHSFEADEKFYRRYLELQARIASSCPALHPSTGQSLVRLPTRSASLRERQASRRGTKDEPSNNVETTASITTPTTKTTVTSQNTTTSRTVSSPTLITQPSIGSSPLKLMVTPATPQTPTPSTPSTPTTPGGSKLSPGNIFKNFFKSFVPPVRDEESETQRKAHAKRVRETRRSTQGVTLEEIKSAEQLVKKKNQQANNNNDQTVTSNVSATATITAAAPTTPIPNAKDEEISHERRPSWRLKVDNNNKFLLEDARSKSSSTTDNSSTYIRRPSTGSTNALTVANSLSTDSSGEATVTVPLRRQDKAEVKEDKENDSRSALATQAVIQRRRKPKRRSTGVVHVDMDEIDPERQDSGGAGDSDSNKVYSDGSDDRSGRSSRLGSESSTGINDDSSRTQKTNEATENGEIDYKKLYEESQAQNERLKEKLKKTEDELTDARSNLEKNVNMNKSSLSEIEKRERRALERKLSEMEEELKLLETLKAENQRLKDENGALIRVISSEAEGFKPRSVDLDKNLVYGGDLPIPTSERSVGSILFDRLAKKERQDKVLQVCASTTKEVTTRVYLQRAVALAERLLESGAKKGDFIALVGNNSVNMNTAMTGIFFLGAVPVPISNKTSLDEFKILMKFMKPKILGCDKKYLYFFRRSLELTQSYDFSKIFLLDEKEGLDENGFEFFKSFIEGRGNVDSFKPSDVEDPRKELALVMKALTDGSIGRGVGITHHNLNSVIARYDVDREEDWSSKTILMVHKVTWMSGIFSLLLNCSLGIKLIIMNEFDENEFLELMEKYKVTTTFLYSSKLWQLYKHEVTRSYDLSACKYVYALDGTLPQSLIDGMKEKMGLTLRTSYGLSEMTGLVLEPSDSAKRGSVGKLVPQLYGKVISSQTSQRVGPNEAGEICFKGPTLTKGYLNDVKSNRLLFDKEGFLMSGHQGYYDEDGDFFIIDKISYFIQYKEFKISPRELEGVIRSMDVVADVAVGAIQTPSDGFYPIAIVALQKGKKATAYDIIKFVDGKVSNYKRLRGGVIFVSKIPRTRDTGIIRRELIRKILSNYQLKEEIPEMLPEN